MCFCCETKSQTNLVPNGSFEEINACPTNGGQIYFANNWFDPNFKSSDLFHSCAINSDYSVPNNFCGVNIAYEGISYAGLTTYWAAVPDIRELIGVKLTEKLVKDEMYCFSMFISLADSCNYTTNNIYLGLSADTLGFYSQSIINPDTKYKLNSPTIDSKSWVKAETSFIADGTEEYVVIGNFDNDINTTVKSINGGDQTVYAYAYIYIDSVQLKLCEITVPNIFTPNGDGINDVWQINLNTYTNIYFTVYNRWGLKVFESRNHFSWDGRTTSGEPCNAGTYYYLVQTETETYKGFLELIR